MADAATLELVGSKTLHNPANASLLAYCPSMELVAAGTQDKHVFIFRINVQRVYGAGQKQKYTALDAQKLAWKPNGEYACLFTDMIPRQTCLKTTDGISVEGRHGQAH